MVVLYRINSLILFIAPPISQAHIYALWLGSRASFVPLVTMILDQSIVDMYPTIR